jgi:iron complex outermembrane receptor protein
MSITSRQHFYCGLGNSSRSVAALICLGTSCLGLQAQSTAGSAGGDGKSTGNVVVLDPYTVSEEKKSPWKAQQTFSGSRVAQNIMDVPVNISIITDQYIKDLGANTLQDVLFYSSSGVNPRVSYRDDISIRGFRETPTRDGLEGTSYSNAPLYDLERIEVIKGPTALVFSNAANLGGTVNYVTKRPTSTNQGDLTIVAGQNQRYGFDVTQRGPINQSGSVRYRVTAGMMQYDGFRELEYENNRLASGGVDWTVTRYLVIRFDGFYTNVTRRDFNRDLVNPSTGRLATFLPSDFTTTADWSKVWTNQYRSRVEAILTPTSNLSFRLLHGTLQNDYGYNVPQPFPGLFAAEAPNFTSIGQRLLNFDLAEHRRDLQLDGTWNVEVGPTTHRLTGGWAHVYADSAQTLFSGVLPNLIISQPISSRPAAPNRTTWTALINNAVSRSEGWSAYVQDSVTFWKDRAIVSAGVRYISKTAVAAGMPAKSLPRYGAVFKITPEISAYYGYAESYRTLTGLDVLGRPLRDIEGSNSEFGLKLDLFGGRLFGAIAHFDMANDPVLTQVQVVDPRTGLTLIGNAQTAKETNKGYEADLGTALDLGPGKLLVLGTLYDADPRNAQGLRPARVARYKATLFSRYELSSGPLKGFSFGGGVSDAGAQNGTGIARQLPWTIYTAVLGYRAAYWSATINIDNLTDVRDAVLGSEASFSVNVARPREAKLSVTYRW